MILAWIVTVGWEEAGCCESWWREGRLPAQVNEVVWECGLGPDCSMCGACFSLRGICTPMTTGETIFASGCIYTYWRVYGCTCAYVRNTVSYQPPDDISRSSAMSVSNVGICAFTTVYIPMFACKPIPTCVWGVSLWSKCFPVSVFSLTTMCTQTPSLHPPTHTHAKSHYHSTLPSTILLNTIKALPLGVCIVNQAWQKGDD